MRAAGVFVGCKACKFSIRGGVQLVNVGTWHDAQRQKVDAENEAKEFHRVVKRGFGKFILGWGFGFCFIYIFIFFVLRIEGRAFLLPGIFLFPFRSLAKN